MRTTSRLLAISSLVLMLVSAAGARMRPRYGGTIRVESENSARASRLVTETLTSVDAAGRTQPLLAERWEAQNGGRRWQFWLRPSVHFHDGKILAPSDVEEALNGAVDAPWRTVRASETTVTFESDDPMPLLPAILSLHHFAIARRDRPGTITIGTGPFREVSLSGTIWQLAAFEDYWRGRPFLDQAEFVTGKSVRDQWMDLGVSRADIVEVPAEQIRHAQQERMRLLVSRDAELIALLPVQNSNALQDARIREAISLAIDRNSLLNVIFQKQGEVADGVLPNWMTGYDFLFAAPQNLPLARDLRAQAKQAAPITIGYTAGDGLRQLLADRVVLNARDADITMQSVPTNGSLPTDLIVERLALASANPDVAFRQMTMALELANAAPSEATPEALFRAERDLLTSYRLIPLLYVPRSFAASPRLRNWALDADGEPELAPVWVEERR
jgi:peptide/nickel transport system substrate-binding protein